MPIQKDWDTEQTAMNDVAVAAGSNSNDIDLESGGWEGVKIRIKPAFPITPTDSLEVEIQSSPNGNEYDRIPEYPMQIGKDDGITGTTTGTTASKLVDSGASFDTNGNKLVGHLVKNLTTNAFARITAVDSGTILSLSADIFTSGDEYSIIPTITITIRDEDHVRVFCKRSGSTDIIDTTIKYKRWRWENV